MKEELRNALFAGVMSALKEQAVQDILTQDQKQAILDIIGATAEIVSDDRMRLSMFGIMLDIDATDANNPKMSMSFDINTLSKLSPSSE